jgi:acyl dehydratase
MTHHRPMPVMNKITANSFFRCEFELSKKDVAAFIKLSGDNNVIHTDAKAAASSPIKALAVPGMLAALVFSRILGISFPGYGTVYRYQNLKFSKPVFVEKKYVAIITVKQLISETHSAIVKTEIRDKAKNTLCIDGQAKVTNLMVL